MADVFISYSKQAPHYTRDLSQRLEARGFTVWWDTELLPGDKFHERIRDEITAAKVVVVIWSPASVGSSWVQAEARMAAAQNKLLTVCTADLDAARVPLPFNMLHIEQIGDHDKLVAAFAARGLYPRNEARARMAQRAEECVRLAKEYYYVEQPAVTDVDRAIKLLEEAIQFGHQSAKVELGRIYAWGEHGKPRPAEALRLLYEAKSAGNPEATACLGQMYFRGIGVSKDVKEAIRLLQEAADAGLSSAHLTLGINYQYGLEVPRNIELAKGHLLKAAESGEAICTYRLGMLYCEEGDFHRGVQHIEKASVLGFRPATLSLSALMIDGRGIVQNIAGGIALLEEVAQSDDKPSRANGLKRLAGLYLTGVGFKENVAKAVSLLSDAVDLGDAEAMCNLADLYEMHPKAPKDPGKVMALLERAVAIGSLDGKARLGRAHMFRKNSTQGLQLLHEAEKEGSGLAAHVLGQCHQFGAGVARNNSEARRWYKVAEARGMNVVEDLKSLAKN